MQVVHVLYLSFPSLGDVRHAIVGAVIPRPVTIRPGNLSFN
jgi:hypothetical protein